MANFHIVLTVDESRLRSQATEGRPIILPIHIQVGEISFPEQNWDDFAVVILGWWAEQIMALRTKCKSRAVLRFMDGPYEVRAVLDSPEICTLVGIEDGLQVSELFRWNVPLDDIMIEISHKAECLLTALKKNNLWDKDCAKLEFLTNQERKRKGTS